MNNYPSLFRFQSNLYEVEKQFIRNWAAEKRHLSLFIIKISKISCPITWSSSNFETEFMFKVANIALFLLFILTFLRSVMNSVFDLDEPFEFKISFERLDTSLLQLWQDFL